jgi:hypothetical protein
MNRHKLLETVSVEMQKALKVYTHDALSRQVTDAAAIDVVNALRDGLRITALHQLDALPAGVVIRSKDRHVYEKYADTHWYPTGFIQPYPSHMRNCLLDAHLLWHPEWAVK